VPAPPVPPVDFAREAPMQALHALAEIRLGRLDHQVDVVVHQAVAQTAPPLRAYDALEKREIPAPIHVVHEQHPPVDPTRIHVVDGAGLFFTRSPRHATHSPEPTNLAPWFLHPTYSRGQTPRRA